MHIKALLQDESSVFDFFFNSFISLEVFQIINTCLLNALIFRDSTICYTKSRINSQGEQVKSNSKECEIGFVLCLLLWLEKRGISAIFHMRLKNLIMMSEGTACFAGRRPGTSEHTVQGKTEQTSYTIKKSSCSFF